MSRENLPALPLALYFPDRGHSMEEWTDLYESFPVIREWMDRTAAAADFDLLHLLFHDREENLQKTRGSNPLCSPWNTPWLDTSPPWVSTRGHGRP